MKPWRLVILTGAGISAESGLKTFRDANGLWENHQIEDVATPEAFERNPSLVHRFYNMRRQQLQEVTPNAAHAALEQLERQWPGEFLLVTQNVDDLHERAGSRQLLHIHGELVKIRCTHCHTVFIYKENLFENTVCAGCGSTGKLRPHIVWFGEMPEHLPTTYAALERCTHFVAIGTSGQVHPAAGFVNHARLARKYEVNLQPSTISGCFHENSFGPATEKVPLLIHNLLATLKV